MKEYHKINAPFKRDMEAKGAPLIMGAFCMPEFEYLANSKWDWFEKIDGTNIRVIWCDGALSFKGRSEKADIPKHLLEKLGKIFTSDHMASVFPNVDVTLYGEGYGAKIQSAGGYLDNDVSFILFDVFIDGWWLLRENKEWLAKQLKIAIVPALGSGTMYEAIDFCRTGFTSRISFDKTLRAEGLIIIPSVELSNRRGDRIITKIKYKDFK